MKKEYYTDYFEENCAKNWKLMGMEKIQNLMKLVNSGAASSCIDG